MTKGMLLILTVNFPYMSIIIVIFQQILHNYGLYILQLIRISRICDTFQSFVIRHRLLSY